MRVGVVSRGRAPTSGPSWRTPLRRSVIPLTVTWRSPQGEFAGVEVVHLARHGKDHLRLSNHVDHRANVAALLDAGVDCLVSTTVCGAVNRAIELGSIVIFDDLYFPSNRLPDGSLCTWHSETSGKGRGHWIFDKPFSAELRQALMEAARMSESSSRRAVTGTLMAHASTREPRSPRWPRLASPRSPDSGSRGCARGRSWASHGTRRLRHRLRQRRLRRGRARRGPARTDPPEYWRLLGSSELAHVPADSCSSAGCGPPVWLVQRR